MCLLTYLLPEVETFVASAIPQAVHVETYGGECLPGVVRYVCKCDGGVCVDVIVGLSVLLCVFIASMFCVAHLGVCAVCNVLLSAIDMY